jgi:uncharacterized membrane protein YbhN (UPF0104 family)
LPHWFNQNAAMTNRKKLVRAIQGLILAVALYFLADAVIEGGAQVKSAVTAQNWHLLAGVFLLAVAAMSWIAFVWVRILRYLNCRISHATGMSIYFVGDSAKYVPGAIWAVLGRSELAAQNGVARADAYASTLLSLVYSFVLSAPLAALLTAPFALVSEEQSLEPLWLFALLPLGLLALHPVIMAIVARWGERIFGRRLDIPILPWGTSILFMFAYLPAWLMIGVSTWLSAEAIGANASPVRLTFAMCLAWAAGFIVIPAPGGLGVREAVFITLMGSSIASPASAAIALITRVAFVLADAAGALVGLVMLKRRREPAD